MSLELKLVGRNGEVEGREWTVVERSIIGRERPAGILIVEPQISRSHAELLANDNTWFVRDLGSANGTWVDGEEIDRQLVPLTTGSVLRLAELVFDVFVEAPLIDLVEPDTIDERFIPSSLPTRHPPPHTMVEMSPPRQPTSSLLPPTNATPPPGGIDPDLQFLYEKMKQELEEKRRECDELRDRLRSRSQPSSVTQEQLRKAREMLDAFGDALAELSDLHEALSRRAGDLPELPALRSSLRRVILRRADLDSLLMLEQGRV